MKASRSTGRLCYFIPYSGTTGALFPDSEEPAGAPGHPIGGEKLISHRGNDVFPYENLLTIAFPLWNEVGNHLLSPH